MQKMLQNWGKRKLSNDISRRQIRRNHFQTVLNKISQSIQNARKLG